MDDYSYDEEQQKQMLHQIYNFGLALSEADYKAWSQEIQEPQYNQVLDPMDARRNGVLVSQMALRNAKAKMNAEKSPAEQYKSYLQKTTGKSKTEIDRWAKQAEDDDQIISSRGR